jgi:asparagine synthase (glutamine-hydrolysing)
LCETAREHGEIVLLEGQGMDEQWAGYEYYGNAAAAAATVGPVQGSQKQSVRPDCLVAEFRALARPLDPPKPFPDALRNRQYLDSFYTKIPRALRFNDRVSMRASTELREPFLDHRLFELAFRQRPERKIANGHRKWMLRQIAAKMLPQEVVEAPKRPVQTPQREWLAGELRGWTVDCIEMALAESGGEWLDPTALRHAWHEYLDSNSDNSFFIWQWISLGLVLAHEMSGVK